MTPPEELSARSQCRQIVCEEWHAAVKEYGLTPNSVTEAVVAAILNRIDAPSIGDADKQADGLEPALAILARCKRSVSPVHDVHVLTTTEAETIATALTASKAKYREQCKYTAAVERERDEARQFVLTFRGEVTAEMVERACMANLHPDTTPSDTERRKMRAALEAANICESCASVADHLQGKLEVAEAKVLALTAALVEARDFIIGLGQIGGDWPRDPYAVTAQADAALEQASKAGGGR